MRVLILGDSTVAWMRPYRNHKNEMTYVELLANSNVYLDVFAIPGMTSREAVRYYWSNLLGKFYDYCIISVGINDLSPRSYPRWLWKIDNHFIVKTRCLEKTFELFYRFFTNSIFQKFCSYMKLSRAWISKKEFEENLLKLQDFILKESDSKIIFLSLPMVSARVNNILHGIDVNILLYKKIISDLHNDRTEILDLDELFKEKMDACNPEGIHYSALGHKMIFEKLYEVIVNGNNENTNDSGG